VEVVQFAWKQTERMIANLLHAQGIEARIVRRTGRAAGGDR
jgi:ribose 5-phosphate isomerase A